MIQKLQKYVNVCSKNKPGAAKRKTNTEIQAKSHTNKGGTRTRTGQQNRHKRENKNVSQKPSTQKGTPENKPKAATS